MEERITLSKSEIYSIPTSELRRFYIVMALSQYRYSRNPEYDEEKLLNYLHKHLKKMLKESEQSLTKDPNNLNLYTIKSYFEHHYCNICRILKIM